MGLLWFGDVEYLTALPRNPASWDQLEDRNEYTLIAYEYQSEALLGEYTKKSYTNHRTLAIILLSSSSDVNLQTSKCR